jgi:hypothetical protein
MKRESAMQMADEREKSVAARKKIFLKANGRRLMRTMVVMVFMSTTCANCPACLRRVSFCRLLGRKMEFARTALL